MHLAEFLKLRGTPIESRVGLHVWEWGLCVCSDPGDNDFWTALSLEVWFCTLSSCSSSPSHYPPLHTPFSSPFLRFYYILLGRKGLEQLE